MTYRIWFTRAMSRSMWLAASSTCVVASALSMFNPSRSGFLRTDTPSRYQMDVKCDLIRWGKLQGIDLAREITISPVPEQGSGVFCGSELIPAGCKIVSVPRSLVISADNVESDPRIGNVVLPLRAAGLDDRGVLAFWVLGESLNEDSRWIEYISRLPSAYELSKSHPLLMAEAIPGTSLDMTVQKMRQNISRQIRSIFSAVKRLDPSAELINLSPQELDERWRWAHVVVMTRSGLLPTKRGSEWTDAPISIVPIVDFCNHSDNPNAQVIFNPDGSVDLVATRNISQGEQICISYWPAKTPLNSEQALFSFGFLSDIDRFVLPGVSFDGCDADAKKAIQRLIFMDTASSAGDSDLPHLNDLDSAITYFTVESMRDRDIIELTRTYLSEGCLGPRTHQLIRAYEPAGKLALERILIDWKRSMGDSTPGNHLLAQFKQRLVNSIDKALTQLNS